MSAVILHSVGAMVHRQSEVVLQSRGVGSMGWTLDAESGGAAAGCCWMGWDKALPHCLPVKFCIVE